MLRKFRNNQGGLKELIYDNMMVIMVVLLIGSIAVTSALKAAEAGTSVNEMKQDLIDVITEESGD